MDMELITKSELANIMATPFVQPRPEIDELVSMWFLSHGFLPPLSRKESSPQASTVVQDFDPYSWPSLPSVWLSNVRRLPVNPAIYFVFRERELFYIGQAARLRRRWGNARQKQFARLGATKVAWLLFDGKSDIARMQEELRLIAILKPRLNRETRSVYAI